VRALGPDPLAPAEASPELIRALRYALYALCAQQALADLAFFLSRGIPVLAEGGPNPVIYMGGFGFVKYLHDANIAGLSALSFLLLLLARDRRAFAVGMVFVAYPLFLMEWGKASIVVVGLLLFTMNLYAARHFGRAFPVRRHLLGVAGIAGATFVAYRFVGVVASGYEATIGGAIAKRILNTADSVFMYFQLGGYEYFRGDVGLLSYLFSSLTPYLGIQDAAQTFGVELPRATLGLGEEGYGAYPPFQVVGHLTLGWGGVVYAFAVGAALAFVKQMRVPLKFAAPYFVVLFAAQFLAGDSSLFAYYLSCQLFNLPAFAAAFAALRFLAPAAEDGPPPSPTGKDGPSQVPVTP
jgi:hypothetical protein